MGYPKNQCKRPEKGEGPRGTMGGNAKTAGKRDAQFSTGDKTVIKGGHTDSWQTGHTLVVRRNG